MSEITITHRAADKKPGMTLAELAAFVQDALRKDIPGNTPVKVQVGFRAQLHTIEITADRDTGT